MEDDILDESWSNPEGAVNEETKYALLDKSEINSEDIIDSCEECSNNYENFIKDENSGKMEYFCPKCPLKCSNNLKSA